MPPADPPNAFLSPPPVVPIAWESIFWALLALALNAMTQPSYVDYRSSARILFPAHSSPIICGADAFEVLASLILIYFYNDTKLSLPSAALRVHQIRISDLTPTTTFNHPISRVILFLTVLTQALKLFGTRNIFWTHIWVSFYLSSFLILFLLDTLSSSAAERDLPYPLPSTTTRLLSITSKTIWTLTALLHLGLYTYTIQSLLQPLLDLKTGSFMIECLSAFMSLSTLLSLLVITLVSVALTAIFLLMLPWRPLNRQTFTSRGPWPPHAVIAFGISIGYVVGFVTVYKCAPAIHHFEFKNLLPLWISIVCFSILLCAVLLLWWLVCIPCKHFPGLCHVVFAGRSYEDVWGNLETVIVLLPVINLVIALLYYRFHFDPSGTVKPSWTEKLG